MFRLSLLCLFGLTCSKVSAEQGTEAIVGGHYAKKGDFKYHVNILFGHYECGGAIIEDHYILTSAHCVTNAAGQIRIERFTVKAGVHDFYDSSESIDIPVETIFIPKHYSVATKLHDIAILKLKHSLNLSHHHNKLEKVKLPKPGAHFENVCAVVTGFGDQEIHVKKNSDGEWEEYGGKSDGILKFASARVISNKKCSELNNEGIPPTKICAQVLQHSQDRPEGVCNGDSGGPLVYGDEIIGVLNRSPIGCNESRKAGTYARVSSYLNFIQHVIHGNLDEDIIWAHVPH